MLGVFSGVKMLFFGAIAAAVLGGWLYVKGLQKDLAIAKENMFKLEQAHQQQKKVIEQQRIDFEAIVQANKKIVEENLLKVNGAEEEDVPFGTHVPFGPMLAVAGLIYFLGFHFYVDAYFADFVYNFLTP